MQFGRILLTFLKLLQQDLDGPMQRIEYTIPLGGPSVDKDLTAESLQVSEGWLGCSKVTSSVYIK